MQTPLTEKDKLLGLYVKAMEQWLPNLPVPEITEWYHGSPAIRPTRRLADEQGPVCQQRVLALDVPTDAGEVRASPVKGSTRASRLRAQAARHLPGRDLGGIHPQLLLPRLSTQNPIRDKLMSQAASTGDLQLALEEMTAEHATKLGLDRPVWQQYIAYMTDVVRLDFNYSITNYPRTVLSMMQDALPWTIGLLERPR